MLKRLQLGLTRGLFFGLVFAWADTLFVYNLAKFVMHMVWNPFTDTTALILTWDVGAAVLLGGLLGLIGGRWLEARLDLFLHAMAICLAAVAAYTTPVVDLMLGMSVLGIGTAHILGLLYARYVKQPGYFVLALPPVMAAFWVGLMSVGLSKTLEHTADPARPRPMATAPNILWVVMDTTRADHLPIYGYARNTAPNLTKLAGEGATFDRAYSTEPWTLASHASMFTGKFSSQHWCNHEHLYLDDQNATLATLLTAAGYDTAIFGGNPWLGDHSGLVRGFTRMESSWREYAVDSLFFMGRVMVKLIDGGQDKGARQSNRAFQSWLAGQQQNKRPFFAFFNYLEPHAPYHHVPVEDAYRFLPPDATPRQADLASRHFTRRMMFANDYQPTARDRELVIDLYDGGIYNADRRLGEVLEMLKITGQYDNTIVIVNADHGEMFGEHGIFGHDLGVYHTLVHVPMVMRWPGKVAAGTRIDKPVQLVDVFPTVLEAAGLTDRIPGDVRGQSLAGVIAGGGDPVRPVFSEYFRPSFRPLIAEMKRMGFDPATFRLRSVQIGDLRLIHWPTVEKLFDVSSDPEENIDLKSGRPQDFNRLKEKLIEFVAQNPARGGELDPGHPEQAPVHTMDRATCERLKALGYVTGKCGD